MYSEKCVLSIGKVNLIQNPLILIHTSLALFLAQSIRDFMQRSSRYICILELVMKGASLQGSFPYIRKFIHVSTRLLLN